MFCTFDRTLSAVDKKSLRSALPQAQAALSGPEAGPEAGPATGPRSVPLISSRSFVGLSSRSKNGCVNCRKKKKKCDEVYPVCGLCARRNTPCVRRDTKKSKTAAKQATKRPKDQDLPPPAPLFDPNDPLDNMLRDLIHSQGEPHALLDTSEDEFAPMDESQIVENQNLSDSELVKLLHRKDTRKFLKPTVFQLFTSKLSPAITVPSNVLTQSLDETGRLFLDHYISFITKEITICHSQESNFFFSYILRLAAQDSAVLNGIVAWGGMFLLGSQNEEARGYFAKSLALAQTRRQQIAAQPTLRDFMALATCFLVLVGAEISTGDIKFWYHIFLQLRDAFSEYGGLRRFFEDTKHANEGKWIISNYFFHDVNATRTVLSGTHEDINTYREIFQGHKILETDEYGLDPFQGSAAELFVIYGEINDKRKELKDLEMRIRVLELSGDESAAKKTVLLNQEKHDFCLAAFEELESRVLQSRPSFKQLEPISNNRDLLALHLTWFELHQITMRLYLRMVVKKTDFRDPEMVALREHADRLLDIVIGTRMQSILCLTLMIAGVVHCDEASRADIAAKYERLVRSFEVKNVQNCWLVVQRCWEIEDDLLRRGEPCYVDWCDVVEDFGWEFCLC
ncbi:hypothetical protein KL920_003943 [Ogataea angusta]|nr:hypothetical protein KL920_003943 [Ogataea angusta]KAG7843981.1 hypothetical protein KL941_004463 [Ogataea angusta]